MKLIIAGGRNYRFTAEDISKLDALADDQWECCDPITEVVYGGATGADSDGKKWAEDGGIPARLFPADWSHWGRSAGPLRNKAMAKYADAVVLFPGGRGTTNMREEAKAANIRIIDLR